MMKKLYYFILALFLVACTNEGTPIEGEGLRISLTLDSGLATDEAGTRVLTKKPITEIQDVWVLQFQNGTCEKALYYKSLATLNEANNTNTGIELTSGQSEIWFVANTENENLFAGKASDSNKMTLTDFKNNYYFNIESENDIVNSKGYLRASGSWEGLVSANTAIHARLIPLAAKINFSYEVITDEATTNKFEITSVALCQVPKHQKFYTQPSDRTETAFPNGIISEYKNHLALNAGETISFYVPENVRDDEVNENQNPAKKNTLPQAKNATYIFITGKLTGKDKEDIIITLYPGENTYNNFNIRPNHVYNVHLKIDVTNGLNVEWFLDTRFTIKKIELPTDRLILRYEFDPEKRQMNSAYASEADGLSPLPVTTSDGAETRYLRNLVDDTYCTQMGKSDNGNADLNDFYEYTEGNDHLDYGYYSFDTGYGSEWSVHTPHTIIFVGTTGEVTYKACFYGTGWTGDKETENTEKKDLYNLNIRSDKQLTYGLGSSENEVEGYIYIYGM